MSTFSRFLLIGLLCLGTIVAGNAPLRAQEGDIISEVIVEGAQRVEPDTVKSYLLLQEGDAFSHARIDRSLKSLFATGLFADVSLHQEGTALIVRVVENPVINRIAFEGNWSFEDETLAAEVGLRPRVIYTRTKVQNDVKRILSLYRRSGYFAATIDPKIIQLDQNRVDLAFEINEGEPTEVGRIRFIGNVEFDDGDLREEIRTKESRWFRFFSSDDNYDPDRLTFDRELLRQFYLKNGFADFSVLSAVAELTPDRSQFFITFTVEEGERYRFGKVAVEPRLEGLTEEQVRGEIVFDEDDWYDSSEIEKSIDEMTEHVSSLGYAFVDVRPRVKRNREDKTIDVTFEISEGARIFVERIDIEGNTRTSGEVIRREFRLVEGDAFNASKLRRSKQRIEGLDFFQKVVIEQVPGAAQDKTVIKVDVEEKSTGTLSLGVGFASAQGLIGDFGIRERNLLGKGYDLRLKGIIAQKRSEIDIGITDPFFLDREIRAGFDVFHISNDFQDTSSYDEKRSGVNFRASFPITERLQQRWQYSFRKETVEDVDDDASSYVKAEEGSQYISEITHALSYDSRDSFLNPTKGNNASWVIDLAGLGGDAQYVRNTFRVGQYYSFAPKWVVMLGGSAGYIVGIDQDVGLLDRYQVGGSKIRGFDSAGIGPRDNSTNDALGGEWFYAGTAELRFPLGLPQEFGFGGRIFTDFGSLGQMEPSSSDVNDTGSLRLTSGVGVSWESPMGPVGIDIGVPLLKEDFDEEQLVRVNFGARL